MHSDKSHPTDGDAAVRGRSTYDAGLSLHIYSSDVSSSLPLPLAMESVRAGFPSPAQDYTDRQIDLNKELIPHPATTFYARVVGDSMHDEGIEDGDILVIDKSLELQDGDLAVCFVDGDFTLKRVRINGDEVLLVPSNDAYPTLHIRKENDFLVWGIVTYTIKNNRRLR